jgi:hypothetical protein
MVEIEVMLLLWDGLGGMTGLATFFGIGGASCMKRRPGTFSYDASGEASIRALFAHVDKVCQLERDLPRIPVLVLQLVRI